MSIDVHASPLDPGGARAGRWILLSGAAAYTLFTVATWSRAYIDFGDGNYLYIATRMAAGDVVYRDILAPQPPCHLFLGAMLVKLAGWIGLESPLYLVRAFSLLMHLARAALVAGIARRAWGCARAGGVAGVLSLWLPVGLWWSLGFQSEPLEIFFLVVMLRLTIVPSARNDLLAGLFGALAVLTNATAAPFLLVLIVYMLARNPRRAMRVAVPAVAVAALVTAALELWTGGRFLQNAVLNQVGTYPDEGLALYIANKLMRETGDIVFYEGIFVALAAVGFFRLLRESPLGREERDGLAWYCLATMASIVYVSKGGTMDYIFSLGEPAVAILASREIVTIAGRLGANSKGSGGAGETALRVCGGVALLAACLTGPAIMYVRLQNQTAFELPSLDRATGAVGEAGPNVEQVVRWIERNSEPGDEILAPPYYAFLSGRKLWGNYSEIFIWTIKDFNDRRSVPPNVEGEGWSKTRAMAAAIEARELPIVIIELDQTGRLPEVMAALEKAYTPIIAEPYRTLNTRLMAFVPKEN